jgi:ABC-type transport system involved in Fe-S cluster assembly fused permease/ATPase subunit
MDSPTTDSPPRTISEALRTTFKLIWAESDAFARRQLAFSFLLLLVGSVLSATYPVIYKLTIDAFTIGVNPAALIGPGLLVTGLVATNYALGLSMGLRQFVHGLGVQRINRLISNRLFGHLVRLPLRYHLERKTGAIGATINQGLSGCQTLLQHAVFTFLPVTIEFIAITVVLMHFEHSAYLGILLVSAVAYGWTFWRAAKQIAPPSRAVSDAHVEAQATLTDSLLNYETVKYFHAERAICSKYDDKLDTREQAWRRVLRMKAGQSAVLNTIFAASMGTSLGYAGWEVLRGTMTIGDFVLINTYVARLVAPLESLGLAARDASQALAYLEKMLDMFREVPEQSEGRKRTDVQNPSGSVAFENVTFSYKEGRATLKDVSFEVAAGRTLGIVGSSGSGKTSIIRLLFRLYEPNSGRILMDDAPISEMPLEELRSAIAVVPQDTVLFNDTIANNIRFGKPDASAEEIEAAARLAHLHELICRMPDGYDTKVGERGLKLSGGEKQRVAIARAALKRPRIYIFDEATSSLDSRTEQEILQNLIDVARTSTTIVIAHRLSTVAHADQIVVLERGEIVEAGSHSELLGVNGAYRALWQAQGRAAEIMPGESAALRSTALAVGD